jgi:hypothetical protein
MTSNIQLKLKKLPEAMAALAHSNQFMKLSAFYAYGLSLLLIGALYVMASRPAEVLTLAPDASIYERIAEPSRETAIRQMAKEYLSLRYRWEPKTVAAQMMEAQSFILPNTRKAFESSTANVIRFAQEKLVAQRVYPEKMIVDLEKQTVLVQGDRVTSIQGLKAAGDLKLELSFEFGPRTAKNPWGIYVTKEREEWP